MFSTAVLQMIERHGYPVLAGTALEAFHDTHEEIVLFFTEQAEKFPETNDVAMILPELVKAFGGRFAAAVVDLPEQRRLQIQFGFREWPTLVFLRRGGYLGAVSRVRDWSVYLAEIERILAGEPTRPPEFLLPVAGGGCQT